MKDGGCTGRIQPFGLFLKSDGERLVIRCVSPVGRLEPESTMAALEQSARSHQVRLGVILGRHDAQYDLTVEGDVLLSDPLQDRARVGVLLRRVLDTGGPTAWLAKFRKPQRTARVLQKVTRSESQAQLKSQRSPATLNEKRNHQGKDNEVLPLNLPKEELPSKLTESERRNLRSQFSVLIQESWYRRQALPQHLPNWLTDEIAKAGGIAEWLERIPVQRQQSGRFENVRSGRLPGMTIRDLLNLPTSSPTKNDSCLHDRP